MTELKRGAGQLIFESFVIQVSNRIDALCLRLVYMLINFVEKNSSKIDICQSSKVFIYATKLVGISAKLKLAV